MIRGRGMQFSRSNRSERQNYVEKAPPPYHQQQQQHQQKQEEEVELISKSIRLPTKRLYLDLKENKRGKFFKITEIVPGGYKSRVLMGLSAAVQLRDELKKISEINSKNVDEFENKENGTQQPPPQQQNKQYSEKRIHSQTIIRDNRRYYIDLNENRRGRFLRIVQIVQSQRSQVVIPGQSLTAFVEATNQVLENVSANEIDDGIQNIMKSKSLRVDKRMYYFDVNNQSGTCLRISEVHPTFRTAINVPSHRWTEFCDVLTHYIGLLDNVKEKYEKQNNGKKPIEKPQADGDAPSTVHIEE
jgi:hypothetical protein